MDLGGNVLVENHVSKTTLRGLHLPFRWSTAKRDQIAGLKRKRQGYLYHSIKDLEREYPGRTFNDCPLIGESNVARWSLKAPVHPDLWRQT